MHLDAMLCDAASVRDNLIHILGGGVSRFAPPQYPGPVNFDLALLFTFEYSEVREDPHVIKVILGPPGGDSIAEVRGDFSLTWRDREKPAQVPIHITLRGAVVQGPGPLEARIILDESPIRTLHVIATDPRPGPDAPPDSL